MIHQATFKYSKIRLNYIRNVQTVIRKNIAKGLI